jgi:hypothetical protein
MTENDRWVSGYCKKCSSKVETYDCQRPLEDYGWQCTNEECEHHNPTYTSDMGWPEWVEGLFRGSRVQL